MTVRTTLLGLALILACVGSLSAQPKLSEEHTPKPSGIALVLSGGGAKGFAHIGVLDVLDSARVPIDLIVGTSIGAAIGGLYAAGYSPKELERFATTTNWEDILGLGSEAHRDELIMSQKDADRALLSLRFTGFFNPVLPQALSSGQRLTMLINAMVLRAPEGVPQDFLRDLRVPFAAVTTDVVHGEQRVLTSGDLTEALRESATLPLTFSPLPQDSVILMDGGLLANIPVDVARSLGASRIIVSNATAPLRSREELNTPWDVADQVITLMMEKQYAPQLSKADVVIAPAVNDRGAYDEQSIRVSIEAGRNAARAMLPKILQITTRTPTTLKSVQDTLVTSLSNIHIVTNQRIDPNPDFVNGYLGQPLVRNLSLSELERETIQHYRASGYSLARIDSVVIDSVRSVSLYVDRGTIGSVLIRSTTAGSATPHLALGELPFSAGDIFRAGAADRAIKNLIGTGLYDYAVLQISYDSLWRGTQIIIHDFQNADKPIVARAPASPTVIVTVHPRASNVIRLGVLADNEFGAQFSAELANENIAGTGVEYSVEGSLGPLARSASLSLEAPRLLRSFALLHAQVYTGYIDINDYAHDIGIQSNRLTSSVTDVVRESRNLGFRLKAGGQIERIAALTGELRSETQEWFSLRESPRTIHTLQLTAFRGEIVVDSRNDASYPHSGSFLRGYAETGQPVAGGNQSYTKLYAELQQVIPVSALHTIIPRVRLGFGDIPLPRLEQFDLGGMESFYGLNAFELRGKQMVAASLTYQIAIPHALYFPTFASFRYDLGATWAEPEAVKWRSLVDGLGAQIGLKTPLGLARFGIGENFRFVEDRPHPLALNTPRFYFSIGSSL